MMASDRRIYDFERAAEAIADWHGKSLEEVRSAGLAVISERIRGMKNGGRAIRWLGRKEPRLAAWVAASYMPALLEKAGEYYTLGSGGPERTAVDAGWAALGMAERSFYHPIDMADLTDAGTAAETASEKILTFSRTKAQAARLPALLISYLSDPGTYLLSFIISNLGGTALNVDTAAEAVMTYPRQRHVGRHTPVWGTRPQR
jgi:hypothetical protein